MCGYQKGNTHVSCVTMAVGHIVRKGMRVYKSRARPKVSHQVADVEANRISRRGYPVKIDKPTKPLPVAPAAKPAGGAQPSAASGTSVHLGSTSAQLLSMEASMANTPLMDAAKVAEIKQAISEGRFQVNSGVVADRLIETVKDLIVAHKA